MTESLRSFEVFAETNWLLYGIAKGLNCVILIVEQCRFMRCFYVRLRPREN